MRFLAGVTRFLLVAVLFAAGASAQTYTSQIGEEDLNIYDGTGATTFTRRTSTGGSSTITKVGAGTIATKTALASTATGNGSDLVGLVGAASGYTLADWHGEVIPAPTIGLSPDNTAAANSAAMTAWAATAPVGTKIQFGGGVYQFATGFTLPDGAHLAGNTHWIGTNTGSEHTALEFTGTTGTFITALGLNLSNITVRGYVANGDAYNAGTVGLSTSGNVYALNATISGFATGWTRTGGYYLKWIGGEFRLCDVCVAGVDLYNIAFIGTKFTRFNTGVTFNGGGGPISFIGCSVEQWTTSFVTALSGASSHINFIGGYVENYPSTAVWSGLTGSYYSAGNLFTTGPSSLQIRDTFFSLNGVPRVVNAGAIRSLQATGNTFFWSAITGSHTGGNNEATVLTDGTKSWTPDLYVGWKVVNTTDGSSGTVTANTETTLTVTALSGGSDNDWDTGDDYRLFKGPTTVFYATGATHVDVRNHWETDPSVDGVTPASAGIVAAAGLYEDEDGYTRLNKRASMQIPITTGAKAGATSGWVVNDATDRGGLAKCPASQTGATLVVPLPNLPVGAVITGYIIHGQIESAGNTVTLDAALRKLTIATADLTDAAVTSGAMTQVTATADRALINTVTQVTGLTETIASRTTYYLLITATTGASTDIDLSSVDILLTGM